MNEPEFGLTHDFTGRTAVVTGAAGVLCSAIVRALLAQGANVAAIVRDVDRAHKLFSQKAASPANLAVVKSDVMDKAGLETAAGEVIDRFGSIDCLINGAGGNHPQGTTGSNQRFFDLPLESLKYVADLNLLGTVLPSQVFGRQMADQGEGVILNISSMSAFRPLTKVVAYSAAKAAVSNFTQWLAVHMATEYSPEIRVNAIAPGFFVTGQNRFLLYDEKTGELTARGQSIIDHTPMRRFGEPKDLLGSVLWLLSPASAFVTGIVVPIDGGFSAFGGV